MLTQRCLKFSGLTARTSIQVGCQVAKLSLRRVSTAHEAIPRSLLESNFGETIGSMRCDCAEQLDEAMPQIAQPITISMAPGISQTIPRQLTDSINADPRESVPATGQAWTTLGQAQTSGKFKNTIRQQYPNKPHIYTIQTQSILGIGQRFFLIRTPKGNIRWEHLAYIDDATVKEINALGGVDAISISHPHFWTTHLTWSRAFNNAPVFLSAEESELVSRPDVHGVRRFVKEKEFEFLPGSGAMRIKTGGHFPGSSVLHYKKSMFLHVTRSALWDINRKPATAYYAFLWSHVNTLPLTPGAIAGIISTIKPYDFDVAHGVFPDRDLRNAKQRAFDSARVVINATGYDAEQYLKAI